MLIWILFFLAWLLSLILVRRGKGKPKYELPTNKDIKVLAQKWQPQDEKDELKCVDMGTWGNPFYKHYPLGEHIHLIAAVSDLDSENLDKDVEKEYYFPGEKRYFLIKAEDICDVDGGFIVKFPKRFTVEEARNKYIIVPLGKEQR